MIWVVTDEPKTRNELVHLVRGRGYEAAPVDCVEDVPKRAKFARPALLVIDCGVGDSFELVTAMRADAFTRPVPLVMFATSNEAYHEEALSRGADAFVLKRSLDWAELLPEIERLIGPPTNPRRPGR